MYQVPEIILRRIDKNLFDEWGAVWAIDNSSLHQVLSHKRIRLRWGPPIGALFALRASPYSPLPTLPVAASAVLVSSPEACCFRFFSTYLFRSQVSIRTYRYISVWVWINKKLDGVQPVALFPCAFCSPSNNCCFFTRAPVGYRL